MFCSEDFEYEEIIYEFNGVSPQLNGDDDGHCKIIEPTN